MCQRYRGFSEMAAELGISVRAVVNPEQRSTTNVGYQLGRRLLFDGMRETAIFAGSDNVALGFLAAAREFCVSVPEEVSLVGFDPAGFCGAEYLCAASPDTAGSLKTGGQSIPADWGTGICITSLNCKYCKVYIHYIMNGLPGDAAAGGNDPSGGKPLSAG